MDLFCFITQYFTEITICKETLAETAKLDLIGNLTNKNNNYDENNI